MWNSMLKVKSSLRQRECQSCEYYDAIRGADLFVVSGQGTLNDLMQRNSANLLEFLEMGRRWRIPTVMLSQGIGPITVPALLDRMKCVLPSVEFITLREKRLGLPLLQSLGVDDSRIAITGDDAVELAYTRRQEKFGCGLGVNLRLANYTGIDLSQLPLIRSVLQRVARRLSAPLIPIPIAHDPSNHDPSAIRELLKGLDTTPDGGESLVSVATTIGQVGRCRVVVTGSYHAGVFAMSQGIPVVGIAATSYYQGKFQGLQDQFGGGCEVLAIKDVAECLEETVERLWMSAEQIRTGLLAAAKQQIEEGLFAYRRALSSIRVQYYNG
jgi:colanic acid/amylovoran biosynthesis protein